MSISMSTRNLNSTTTTTITSDGAHTTVTINTIRNGNAPATTATTVIQCKDDDDQATTCAICMDDMIMPSYKILKLPCNHQFHDHCIFRWIFRGKYTCPICRATLPKDTPIKHTLQLFTQVLQLKTKDWKQQVIGLIIAVLGILHVHPPTSEQLEKPYISEAWKHLYIFITKTYPNVSIDQEPKRADAESEWEYFNLIRCRYCYNRLNTESNQMKTVLRHLETVLTVSPIFERLMQHILCVFLAILYLLDREPDSVADAHLFFQPVISALGGLQELIRSDN